MSSIHGTHGFTVIEALVALAIVTSGVLGLAALAAQVTDVVARSRRHTTAALLADQGVAARVGGPWTSTPASCLQRDVAGCFERLDAQGLVTHNPAAFVRRWRTAPLVSSVPRLWGVTVCVVPASLGGITGATPGACVGRVVWEPRP